MESVRDIFDAFSGPAALGRAIGIHTSHAVMMRRRGSVPVKYWPALLAAAKQIGVDLDESTLIKAHANKNLHHSPQAGAL